MADDFDPTVIPSFTTHDLEEAKRNEAYLGGMVIDRFEPTVNYDGKPVWQYHWAVRPVSIQVTGKTGAFHGFVDYKLGRSSNFLLLTDAITTIHGATLNGQPRAFGKSDNEGLVIGWWVNETFSEFKKRMGGAVNSKFVATKEWPMPVRIATPDEIAVYRALPAFVPPASTAAPRELEPEQSAEYSPEQIEQLAAFYDGKLVAQAVRAAHTNGTLPPELRQDVLSGRAYRTLVTLGALTQNADKTFSRARVG